MPRATAGLQAEESLDGFDVSIGPVECRKASIGAGKRAAFKAFQSAGLAEAHAAKMKQIIASQGPRHTVPYCIKGIPRLR